MSASIVTFANLGKKRNLKTADIVPVIEALANSNELQQVICQINKDFPFRSTSPAFPLIVRLGMGALRRIPGLSPSRQMLERVFDFFAARKLIAVDATFLHGGYFLSRTTQRAHELGSISIDMAVSAHLKTNAMFEKEEFTHLGFPNYEGLYTRLVRESHQAHEFDYVIAMSSFVKDSYVAAGFPVEKIFIAQPDIDISRFHVSSKKQETSFRILYMAHTQPLKGLHYLLDAWETSNILNAELVIVGGFSDMPDILKARYMNRIESDSRITLIPSTETPEKYYQEASVLVLPSLSEGFGRVTLEAMASGLPVITTNNAAGIVEERQTGFIVPIRDAATLAEKIQYIYEHREEGESMGKKARLAVERKKPFGELVYGIYQEILRREHKI